MKKNRGPAWGTIGIAAAVILLAGLAFCSGKNSPSPGTQAYSAAQETGSQPVADQAPQSSGRSFLVQMSQAFEDAAAAVGPSVVPIYAEQVVSVQSPFGSPEDPFRQFFGDDFFKRFFGGQPQAPQRQAVRSLGSGVIISADGFILTNNHVVDGAQKLNVFIGDKKRYPATIIGTDPQTDVALIKIDASGLTPARLGDSSGVKVGQWVIAVGNPFQLLHTVTAGIISARGRSVVGLAEYADFIQTDASINPGNSGGALADLEGQVIGINTAIANPTGSGGNIGIGFAIPINMAREIMETLRSKGKVVRGYLALVPQDIDEDLAKALNLPTTEGTLVADVTPGGPADKAGIKRGDVILDVNGRAVEDSTALRTMVAQAAPGSSIKIGLLRDGKKMPLTAVLGERPSGKGSETPSQEKASRSASRVIGLSLQDLTPEIAGQLGYEKDRGAVVTGVEPGSPADDAGIQPGDLVKEVNRVAVRSAQECETALRDLKKGDTAALLIRRGDQTRYVAIRIP